jgi:PPOX class probable F420-dependent enzyme
MPTTLDPATPDSARALARLATDRIGWLTTISPDGVPQSTPIWFLWRDGELLIYSHKRARRNGNIADRPAVAFNLHTDPGGGDVVTMEGLARIDLTAPAADDDPVYLEKYASMIAGYEWTPAWFAEEYAIPVRVTPTRWRLE